MSTFLQFALALSIIITFAKLGGLLSTRIRQPSVLGELLVGVILGPSVLNFLHWPIFSEAHLLEEVFHLLAETGVMLLMFVAGLELHISDLLRNTKVSAFSGILGVIVPALFGWGTGRLFGLDNQQAIFLGLTLGATSVSISAQTLIELKSLRTRVGMGLLGAAVFDDVLVIVLLSGFLALMHGSGGILAVGMIFVRMAVFLALAAAFGQWGLPRLTRRIARLPVSEGVLTLALVVGLAFGIAAEVVGSMAAITGAFLAGLMFSRSAEKDRIERGTHALAYALFVPVFFVQIGLSLNLREIGLGSLPFVLAVVGVAVAAKFIGAAGGARLAGFSWLEASQLGAGMISRGEVGLILATVGIQEDLLNQIQFSAVVDVVLVTTLLTPPILRLLFARSGHITETHAERSSP
jgi:Kef-type K+ transport system membrane component KefB